MSNEDDYLCQRLGSELQNEKATALHELAEREYSKQQAANCRLTGACKHLVDALDSATSGLTAASQQQVLILVEKWCAVDVHCKDHFVKLGVIRKLAILLFTDDMEIIHRTLLALVPLTYTGDLTSRNMEAVKSSFEELFRSGAVSRMIRFLELSTEKVHRDVTLQSIINITYLADVPWYRERLRDLGIIPLSIALVRADPDEWEYVANVYNMSRAESVHLSLKEHGVLQVLQEVINQSNKEVVKMLGLITVANIYGGEESNDPCQKLLSEHDVSRHVIQMLDSTKDGDGLYREIPFATEESVSAVRSLARNTTSAESLVQNGAIPLLLEVLGNAKHSKAVYVQCCHALANLAHVKKLQPVILELDVVEVVQRFEADTEVRLADAAKGVLLTLSKVKDTAVLAAAAAMQGTDQDFAQCYDVFLSHKRTDSKDFARALYNLLVTRGIRTFLDFEYREELKDLGKIVANCHNLVFILTDNIFDSHWCMEELQAAVDKNVNIILVVKEGSRWKDTNGNKVCEFPPYELINTLSLSIQQVFTRKAITHSDEYYQAFVDNMLKKIQIPIRPAAAAGVHSAPPAGVQPHVLPQLPVAAAHSQQQALASAAAAPQYPAASQPQTAIAVQNKRASGASAAADDPYNAFQQAISGSSLHAIPGANSMMFGAPPMFPTGMPFMTSPMPYGYMPVAPQPAAQVPPSQELGALGRDITAEVRQLGRTISLELQQLQQAQSMGSQLMVRNLSHELLQHNSSVVSLLQSQQQVLWGLKERVGSLEGVVGQLAGSVNALLAMFTPAMPARASLLIGPDRLQPSYSHSACSSEPSELPSAGVMPSAGGLGGGGGGSSSGSAGGGSTGGSKSRANTSNFRQSHYQVQRPSAAPAAPALDAGLPPLLARGRGTSTTTRQATGG
ncbi:hypothetical protein TSOC_001876 [Tetrabaena socialis]|uniref:TIR domain-containing protein n=1 Tax=Tetrabaena socialis TaxID=47790 RepID=A0A2J8AFK5_9CHLO|nr:hypothetical protein TSOC_001876 [Tetrabaena socialis]|eukprot:PNH11286.1 hypothetical protein TSOC_001876 [Tetrabaena socialis]